MLQTKDFFIKTSFHQFYYPICNLPISRLTKAPRHIYYLNEYKQFRFKYEEKFNSFRFKQINFELLIVFYQVVVCGSVSKAAKQLSISQPAISLSLRKLEKELGSILFRQINSKRVIRLTPYGSIVFNHIQRLFQIVEETFELNNFDSSFLKLNDAIQPKFKTINLFPIFNRKILSYSNINHQIFTSVSGKYSINFAKLNFKSSSNESKFIMLKRKFINSENSYQIINNESLFTSFLLDRTSSIKNLNNKIFSSLDNTNLIEIQTTNAFRLCLEMKISDFICWGSEI